MNAIFLNCFIKSNKLVKPIVFVTPCWPIGITVYWKRSIGVICCMKVTFATWVNFQISIQYMMLRPQLFELTNYWLFVQLLSSSWNKQTILFPQDMIQDIYKLHWNIIHISIGEMWNVVPYKLIRLDCWLWIVHQLAECSRRWRRRGGRGYITVDDCFGRISEGTMNWFAELDVDEHGLSTTWLGVVGDGEDGWRLLAVGCFCRFWSGDDIIFIIGNICIW